MKYPGQGAAPLCQFFLKNIKNCGILPENLL